MISISSGFFSSSTTYGRLMVRRPSLFSAFIADLSMQSPSLSANWYAYDEMPR